MDRFFRPATVSAVAEGAWIRRTTEARTMQFRWVAAITVWTVISGPVFGPPHAPRLVTGLPTVAASAKPRSRLPLQQTTMPSTVRSAAARQK